MVLPSVGIPGHNAVYQTEGFLLGRTSYFATQEDQTGTGSQNGMTLRELRYRPEKTAQSHQLANSGGLPPGHDEAVDMGKIVYRSDLISGAPQVLNHLAVHVKIALKRQETNGAGVGQPCGHFAYERSCSFRQGRD